MGYSVLMVLLWLVLLPAGAPPGTCEPMQCARDEGKDRVCGPRPGSLRGAPAKACPASPATLDLRMHQAVVFSQPLSPEEEMLRLGYAGFVFEKEQERHYPRDQAREGFRPEGATFPVVECCYVKCTRLEVAAKGSREGTPLGFCMEPLTGGTSAPARGAPDCPRAVKVAGAYRAFTEKTESGVCCYALPPPPPPSR
jgi:hypothetical protein